MQETLTAKGKTHGRLSFSLRVIVSLAGMLVLLVLTGTAVYGVYGYDRVYGGVTLDGQDVSGMTYAQILEIQREKAAAPVLAEAELIVYLDDAPCLFTIGNTGAKMLTDGPSPESVADEVLAVGRDGSFFKRLGVILGKGDKAVESVYTDEFYIDKQAILDILTKTAQELSFAMIPTSYTQQEDGLVFIRGRAGKTIQVEPIADIIAEHIRTRNFTELAFKTINLPPDEPDVEALHRSLCAAPRNAVLSREGIDVTVVPHEDGRDFDKQAVKDWLNNEGGPETFRAPFAVLPAEITKETLESQLFRDELAYYTTSMSGSTANRKNNIALASGFINETVYMPGECFDFNAVVGRRTEARGFKEAGTFLNGEVVDNVGGGICQVSSTLYNAALQANLKIVNRRPHSMKVTYVPSGLDAAVSYNSIEFVFENNRDYPIRLQMWTENNTVFARIIGTKVDDNVVEMERIELSHTPAGVKEIYNPSLAPGTSVITQAGHDGGSVQTYRIVKDKDGNILSRKPEAKSTYRVGNKVVEFGPPLPETSPPPDTPSQEPSEQEPPEQEPPEQEPLETL